MRTWRLPSLVMLGVAAGAIHASALERVGEVPATDLDLPWDTASTCAVAYSNTCTGWTWRWSIGEGHRYGVVFDPCCEGAILDATAMELASVYYGWGYSGILEVSAVDGDGCPAATLASRSFYSEGGLLIENWGVPCDGPVVVTLQVSYASYGPAGLSTDHPAAGPTGGQACGYCYSSARTTHSFYFGTSNSPLCPGSPLNDGACDVEFRWSAIFSCASSVDASSWAALKALYR